MLDTEREKGPIEILCKEIGFTFDPRLERPEMLIGFVSVLVSHVAAMRRFQEEMAKYGAQAPSEDSEQVLRLVLGLLATNDYDTLIDRSREVHDFIHMVAPDEAIPCDHLIDMLSSCVSAIRFGVEVPCRSRHAADAAQHIWKHVYGVRLFDRFTPAWQNEWARAQLQEAILLRLTPETLPTEPVT